MAITGGSHHRVVRSTPLAGASMTRGYQPNPCYPTHGGVVQIGWHEPVDALRDGTPLVLALDGPAVLDWAPLVDDLSQALEGLETTTARLDVRDWYAPWPEVVRRTTSPELADDPHFERLAEGELSRVFDVLPTPHRPRSGVLLVFGPGAALVDHDVLWYLDLPKRYAEARVAAGHGRNLGQGATDGPATTRRLFYVDWPLLDRHRDHISPRIDRWFDAQDPARLSSLDGSTLRATMAALARRPFRTRPTFNTTPWGGHWGQRELGMNPRASNTALGYELIAPESGLLCGDAGARVEVPFQLLVDAHPHEVLGARTHERFGTSFPIRFDYLDTVDGANLSVHCHPQPEYMARVFGWPYTQHETYYLMVAGKGTKVFLGLREGVDPAAFRRDAERAQREGTPFDIERHVQTFAATPHQLFCIPAGTPHGSGVGNVVLEVSATPYLYSLRFYDWLRRDARGSQRPIHVEHAFNNLDPRWSGPAVGEALVQRPRVLRAADGWSEELLGSRPEMFFEVRRLVLNSQAAVPDDASDGFHVLNVVEGDGLRIETSDGSVHHLNYAETLVVPAAVGPYRLKRVGSSRVRVVKALVSS